VQQSSWGVLFDWDGVIIDSSSQHERAWELLAAEERFTLPEGHFKAGFGKKNEVIIPALGWALDPSEINRLSFRKEEIYRELVSFEGLVILPGAAELLGSLRDAGIPRALGSSTPRENLDALFAVSGLDSLFDAVVCGSDVSRGKPDPEVFLKGAGFLGLPPGRCVVVEDAFAGIEAARSGGMKVVGVATTNPLDSLSGCDLAVMSLAELDPPRLGALFPDA
jgi:HAD superfamily hydrolase (TIGR01509 family)